MKFKKPLSLLLAAVLLCAFAVPLLETPALAADKEIHEVATVGVYKWITITAEDGGEDVVVTNVVQTGGKLPPGMSLGKNQNVSCLVGTPTTPGTYILTGETHYEDDAASWKCTWSVRLFVDVAATPTPTPTTAPTTAPTAAPTTGTTTAPTNTPTPTNTPAPTAGAPIITKQPTKETVEVGGSATFVANATGWAWCAWRFLSPDGKTEVIFDVTADKFPGLTTPDESYHGVTYAEKFGLEGAFITKATAQLMRDLGSIQSPQNAFLLNLGLETLHLRMPQHCKNAQAVAEYLAQNDKVAWVNYCGLPGDKYYEQAQKYMPNGSCGVVTFGLKGGREESIKFMDSLKLAAIVTHVADARTCVLHPASHTHRQLTDEQLMEAGVRPDLIRFSVGIENAEDIIADIEQALNA